ncbi:hypothetical protein ACCY75_01220 [Enterobacter kobei]|uniref:hypothetical protein n=1 Tax=Enterobacter kobei TaxID=208224 RepID=UPI003ED8DD1C
MTVSSEQSYIEYNGDGVTKTFTIPFYFILGSDISITLTDSNGIETPLAYGLDYSVVGDGSSSGGAATLNVAPSTGVEVTIYRNPAVTQETTYYENGKFPAKSHEKALDKLTMLIQTALYRLNIYNSKSIKVPESGNWVAPKIADRKNKIFAWGDSGQPISILPPDGSASDVLIELAKPTGAWLIGRSNSLQQLLTFNVQAGYVYETDGYYSPGDGGGARYLISSTQGDIPELAYLCSNGLYAILQHNGTISIEQLGGKGVSLGQTATDDSWPAFYKAYQIKRAHLFDLSLEFIAGKSAYYCSKPVLLTTGMTLRTPNSSWICKVIYGGGTVTKTEVPDVTPPIVDDPVIDFSTKRAHVLVIGSNGNPCYYSTLDGFQFRNLAPISPVGLYGVYAPYMSKVNIKNCRHEKVNYGIRWINNWGGSIDQCIYLGIDTSTTPLSGSAGVWGEPSAGISSYTNGGTSLLLNIVGTSGFQTGFKMTNQQYTTMNSCYSEKGNDRAIELTGCDGVVINSFGLENLINTLFSCIRFNNSRVTLNSLVFAFNNVASGGNVVFATDRSKVNISGISFGRLTNTGSSLSLFNADGTSEISVDGPVDIPASLSSSTGYGFATVNGKLYSDNIFSGTLGIANGSATTNSVTFTANEFSYKFKGGSVWFNYYASWTGGSGTDMQVYGFPKTFAKECTFHASLPAASKVVYARTVLATNRVRISGATDASNTTIPTSGALFIQGEYVI